MPRSLRRRWLSTLPRHTACEPRRRRGPPRAVREQGKSKTRGGKGVKGARWSLLLEAPERQSVYQLAALADVQDANRRLYARSS